MTNQPDRRPRGPYPKACAMTICDGALETLKQSLDAFVTSICSQQQTVGAMRRLNERGLQSDQEVHALDVVINRLITDRLLRGAVEDKADGHKS